jgi:hypothetical protein
LRKILSREDGDWRQNAGFFGVFVESRKTRIALGRVPPTCAKPRLMRTW